MTNKELLILVHDDDVREYTDDFVSVRLKIPEEIQTNKTLMDQIMSSAKQAIQRKRKEVLS